MSATRNAVENALAHATHRLPNAEAGAREVAGYMRFLHYGASHLHTLLQLAEVRNDHATQLVEKLANTDDESPTGGQWYEAATLLGAAHDLLTTHLTGVGVPRTPEAEDILAGPDALPSCIEVAKLISASVDGSHELLHQASRAQQGRPDKLIATRTFYRFHQLSHTVSLCARAALWDLTNLAHDLPQSRLAGLRSAVDLNTPSPPTFATSIGALRLLRQYSHAQARGLAPASPASLRDLALLGMRLTDPAAAPPEHQEHGTPLDRLVRAHLADHLAEAHKAWSIASHELASSVQGLTKAPGACGTAVHQLLDADLTPKLRRTLASMLPRMGVEAAVTIQLLAERADLVTLQRPALKTRHEWRPILPEHAASIADHFSAAARATRHASATLASVEAPSARPEARPMGTTIRLERRRQLRQ